MTTWNLDEYIAAHQSVYAYYREVCARRSAEQLAVQSLCPDWDVRGVVAHTIGVEAVLDGWERQAFTAAGFRRETYRRGTGPGVIVVHEISSSLSLFPLTRFRTRSCCSINDATRCS